MAAYVQDEWEVIAARSIWVPGFATARSHSLVHIPFIERDVNGNKTDSTYYGRGEAIKTYGGPEPRLTITVWHKRRNIFESRCCTEISSTFTWLVMPGSTLPTDLWVPSTYRVKPQISWQYAAGSV